MTLIKPEKPSEPQHELKVKAMQWCNKNNIKIYFQPIDWRRGRIVIDDDGKISESEEIYLQNKLKPKDTRYWNVVYDLYYKLFKEKQNE